MKEPFKKVANAARATMFLLTPLFKRCFEPIRTKLSLYKARNPADGQNLTLQRVTEVPYYVRNTTLHRDIKIESLEVHIGRLASNVFYRADVPCHLHLRNITQRLTRLPEVRRRLPSDFLFSLESDY